MCNGYLNVFCTYYRCGIPVVIMGETGCGKTRLIRYMCDLARQGMEGTNMLIMKVFYLIMIVSLYSFIAGYLGRGSPQLLTNYTPH